VPGSNGADVPGGGTVGVDATRILFVCTANRCRSPMAEALARRRFAGLPFEFGSAGLLDDGRPMPAAGVLVAGEEGLDMSQHLSSTLDPAHLETWDVVLTMSRSHTRDLVAADPDLWPRAFTLPQFARWIDAHPIGRHARLRGWVDLAGADRPRSEMIGSRADDEIADPVDGPPPAWRALVARLTADLDTIAARLAPGSDAHPRGDAIAEAGPVEPLRALPAGRRARRKRDLDRPA
jgi:protein-tyrosine phosphatase